MKKKFFTFFFSLFFAQALQADEWIFPRTDTLPQSLTLFFFGDVMQHDPQIKGAYNPVTQEYDYKHCFQYMVPYWQAADFVIANLETTLDDKNFGGYPNFCSPWQLARDLQFCGVDILTTNNNHSCDKGATGIRRTIQWLDSLEIGHTGTFTDTLSWQKSVPLYIRQEGFKIALLSYTYGTNGIPVTGGQVVSMIDSAVILNDIAKARLDSATHIIAIMHWGDEYFTSPNATQKGLARWLHDNSADIVIGSHPHVVQPVEYTTQGTDTTGVTVYSLGNFISNQSKRYTTGGIGLRLTLSRNREGKTGYRMEYLNNYVYRPIENGRRRYYVVPENYAHEIPALQADSTARQSYRDTDSIINGVIPKITKAEWNF